MSHAVLLALLAACPPGTAQDDTLLPAPFQIDDVERDLSERMSRDSPPFVRVDLGTAERRPVPARDGLETMTILGSAGTSEASLHDIEKICEYLCGDELETCHYVARVAVHRPLEEIGTPLAAFAGEVAVGRFRPAVAEPIGVPANWPTEPSGEPVEPVWSPYSAQGPSAHGPEYRLLVAERPGFELRIEVRSGGRVFPTEDRDCRLRRYGELDAVACSSFAAIVADGRPLLVSFPDYNFPVAEPVASFEFAGDTYRLVRLGLKAQTVHGLLVKTATGWHGAFRPRDYPLLC